ncbi:MAG: hypothetical protein JWQ18_393 [Conexibacter sp.]|nr:hypothetical protein [Conexibacter sp.]
MTVAEHPASVGGRADGRTLIGTIDPAAGLRILADAVRTLSHAARPMHALVVAGADPSPWEFGWEGLVAIGTLLLALATGGLALSTRNLARKTAEEVKHSGRLVEESQRQAEAAINQATATQAALAEARKQTNISEQTLNAQIRPVLVDVPFEAGINERLSFPGRDKSVISRRGAVVVSVGDGDVLISVPIRNAGVGLAMIRGISLEIGTPIAPPDVSIMPTNIGPGERGRLNFRMEQGHNAYATLAKLLARKQSLSVVVAYSDLAGRQLTLSRYDLYHRERALSGWDVRQVHLQEPDADLPYAGSAPTF